MLYGWGCPIFPTHLCALVVPWYLSLSCEKDFCGRGMMAQHFSLTAGLLKQQVCDLTVGIQMPSPQPQCSFNVSFCILNEVSSIHISFLVTCLMFLCLIINFIGCFCFCFF